MKRKLAMMLACMLVAVTALAQSAINGTVVSAQDGEPIIGATVKIKGSTQGTVTDMNGKFAIDAKGKTIVVSYIGMQPVEATAKNGMKVTLNSEDALLDEVMVVAYGTTKKSSFTGAAAVVKGDEMEKLQVSDLGKALEGSVAGVTITSETGDPGSEASILIRGVGSISASTRPLIVLDGVPYEGSLNSIPTHDIESMTVLKDAAANSMYGARGSNGVIMITTKRGKNGKMAINFDGRWGINTRGVSNYDIVSDAGEYYELAWEGIRNNVLSDLGSYQAANQYAAQNLVSGYLKYNCFKGIADTDIIDPATGRINPNATTKKWSDNWQEDPFKTQLRQEYNINISGGNDKTQGYVSAGYLNDKGYVDKSGFKRYSVRAKVDHNLNSWISAGASLSYVQTDKESFNDGTTGSSYNNLFYFTQSIAPIYPIYFYDKDGNRVPNKANGEYDFGDEYGRPYASSSNPVGQANGSKNRILIDNFSSRGYVNITLPYGFKLAANIAYDLFNDRENYYMTPVGGDAFEYGGRGYKYSTRTGALNVNEILDWTHDFGKHNVHIKLGHENKCDEYNYLYGHMTRFADANNDEFANATVYQDLNSYSTKYALEGFFTQGEYNYADRYYLTASIRRDGSSRFSKDNRWGTFWAVGASWRIKEESFLKDVKWLDNLKLKASYGTQGNDNLTGTYRYFYSDLYRVDRVNGDPALNKVFRGNEDLSWEKSRNFNAGFDAGFLNRIRFNFEYFVKETRDMLYASPLAPSGGSPSYIYRNEMNMKNKGFEVEVSADIIKNSNIHWNVAFNGSHYKNELTRLPASKTDPKGYQQGYYWRKLGGTLYDWYLYEYMGVDAKNGKPQYAAYTEMTQEEWNALSDANKAKYVSYDGKEAKRIVNTTDEASRRETGKSSLPSFTGGISTYVEAYGFDLSIQTAFSFGGWVLDETYAGLLNSGFSAGDNFHKDIFNRWTPANTNTNIPALMIGKQAQGIDSASDFFLTRANYFSLRNVTLGYTLPKSILKGTGLEKVRVYVVGDNLWLKTNRKGLDTRQYIDGSTTYGYSALSSYSIGINVSL